MIGPAELFVRPHDLAVAVEPTGAIPARVLGIRRTGPGRRAELSFGETLPSVEIELPVDRTVEAGEVLPVSFSSLRLFSVR